MKTNHVIFLIFCFLFCSYYLSASPIKTLISPDGKLTANFQLDESGNHSYRLEIDKKEVIKSSKLGCNIAPEENIPSKEWSINEVNIRSNNSVWKPVWGKRAVVNDYYNEIVFELKGPGNNSFDQLTLEARACNDGIAFRYRIPETVKGTLNPAAELTEYRFADDYTAWFYNGEYPNSGPEKLSETSGKRLPVMTVIKASDGYFYLYAMEDIRNTPIYRSKNLVDCSIGVATSNSAYLKVHSNRNLHCLLCI